MEYGEALNPRALERAVALARQLSSESPRAPAAIAAEAVSRAYCVCVTTGEDAAERRMSGLHQSLIDAVVERLTRDEETATGSSQSSTEDCKWR